jgi:transposase
MSPAVMIGVDLHKYSVTIEVLGRRERVLHTGRYTTDRDGYRQLLAAARRWPQRSWAVEGCNGAGRPVAQRLVADGELVLDVPAKLAARVRVMDTGNGRRSDPADAHSVAVLGLCTTGLTQVGIDEQSVVLRLLCDRRDELARARTQPVNRLHRLLSELVPGGAPRFLSALQAKALLATVHPRDAAGPTRRQLAADLLGEVVLLDRKLKANEAKLREAVTATGTHLMGLYGVGPAGAARLLGDVSDIARFGTRDRFASWNATAPLDASSGQQQRHRLSRAGNRRINRVLHIMAIVQIRHDTEGRTYYRRRLAAGKTPMEALRCLKRRLSNVVYRQMLADTKAGPGGQAGASTTSNAADQIRTVGTSQQPPPGPVTQPTDPIAIEVAAGAATPPRDRPLPARTPASTGVVADPGSRAARQGRRAPTRSALQAPGTTPQARRGTTATAGP